MLTTKYVAEVTRWRNSQKEFKSVSTAKTKARLQSYDPEITNDDVEKIMLSDGGVDKFIHAHIVGTGETQAIRDAYTKAQDKKQAMLELEAQVKELNKMFLDMAYLVEAQAELLDQIEFNVNSTMDFVERGNKEMEGAIHQQDQNRKCMCYLALGLVAIIGFFILMNQIGLF